MNSNKIGVFGEKIAERYLKKKGYKILDRNYSERFISGPQKGEIDIIAKAQDTICFVEVKTLSRVRGGRTSASFPEEKVDFRKQRKIIKMAERWLRDKKIPLESKWQIDVISVIVDVKEKKAKVRHLKNATPY